MGRRRKEEGAPEEKKPVNNFSPDDLIYLLAMNHAQAVVVSKTIQHGFGCLITAMGAKPSADYPDPSEVFMEAFDAMLGEPDEEIPPAEDAGATTG